MYLKANCVYNPVLYKYHDLIVDLLSISGQLNAHSLRVFLLITSAPQLRVVKKTRWRLES